MPPYNRSSCNQADLGNFCHKSLSIDEDGLGDRSTPLPREGSISDLCVFEGLPRRQVTFAVDQEHVYLIRGRGDCSNGEIQGCWYTKTDLLTFKQEALATLEIYNRSPTRVRNNVEYTMRGLEHHLEKVRNRRKLLRLVTKRFVLNYQELFHVTSESKSEHVAKMCSVASRDSVCIALCKAAIDQVEADEYQRETASELFNDEWIRCISSTGKNVSYPQNHQQTWSMGCGAKEDVSGFDDSWLCVP